MLGELNTNEQSVLGSIFLSEDALEKAVAALSVDDFTDYRNQIIWRHVLQLHNAGRPANNPELLVTSLRNTIDRAGQSDLDHAGGLVYIGTIIDSVAVAHHVSYLIAEVLKASTVRRLKAVGREITAKAEQHPLNEDTADLVSQCEQLVSDAFDRSAKTGGNHNSLRELLEHALERIDQRRNGICNSGLSTGFTGLDKIMGGLRPGELIVLGARPGCGKSALAMNLAHNMTAHHKRRVMLISLEMSSTEIADRMLGSAAKVNTHRMRNGSLTAGDRESIVAAYGLMSTASLFIDDKPSCTCAQISSQARSIKRRHGLDCLVGDYWQLIVPENAKDIRQEQVAKMSRRLKVLARELQIPIICLSQLNRQADDASKPPRLSQLRESGAIEQDADAVLFIHRPDANKPESQVPSVESVELHVAKQRNGPTGIVELRWHRSHCSFESADDAWKERTDSSFDDWNNSGADDTPGA